MRSIDAPKRARIRFSQIKLVRNTSASCTHTTPLTTNGLPTRSEPPCSVTSNTAGHLLRRLVQHKTAAVRGRCCGKYWQDALSRRRGQVLQEEARIIVRMIREEYNQHAQKDHSRQDCHLFTMRGAQARGQDRKPLRPAQHTLCIIKTENRERSISSYVRVQVPALAVHCDMVSIQCSRSISLVVISLVACSPNKTCGPHTVRTLARG
jgi:hypothetical protein